MPVGSMPSFFQSACRFSGASFSVALGSSRPGELGHEDSPPGRRRLPDRRVPSVAISKNARRLAQAARVGNLVFAALALRDQLQGAHQHAAVVGVGGGAGGDLAQQVARRDGVGVGAADAELRLGRDAARSHVAEPAANAVGAELALRVLGLVAVPDGRDLASFAAICTISLMAGSRETVLSRPVAVVRHQRLSFESRAIFRADD